MDKHRRASTTSGEGRPVANVVREPYGPYHLEVCLVEETNINAVLTEELFQMQLPADDTVSIPAASLYPGG
jgi:hypothetical protein